MKTKHLTRPFEIKAANDDGSFEGYASVFEVKDSYADVVKQGAFTRSLDEHKAAGTMPALLWQHRHDEPIGVWTEMHEDEHGLYGKGQIVDTQRGQDALKLLRAKAVTGISIGYALRKYERDEKNDILNILDVDLWESSIVTFPANEEARVTEVRAALEAGEFPTVRDFERYLTHDAGFTRSQARTILNQGYKALTQDAEPDAEIDWTEVRQLLQTRIQ